MSTNDTITIGTLRRRARLAWERHHAGHVRPGASALGSYADLARKLEAQALDLEGPMPPQDPAWLLERVPETVTDEALRNVMLRDGGR